MSVSALTSTIEVKVLEADEVVAGEEVEIDGEETAAVSSESSPLRNRENIVCTCKLA